MAGFRFDRAEAARLYVGGESIHEIGRRLGVTGEAVRVALRKHLGADAFERVKVTNRGWTPEEREEILAVAVAHGTRAAVAKTGVKLNTLHKWLRDAGLTAAPAPLRPCGTLAAYRRGCRCGECRSANREYQRRICAELSTRTEQAPHGTLSGYVNWSCRCSQCSAVHQVEMVRQYASRNERRERGEMPEHIHGTPSGYNAWGCRCDPCRGAFSEYEKRRYASRKRNAA